MLGPMEILNSADSNTVKPPNQSQLDHASEWLNSLPSQRKCFNRMTVLGRAPSPLGCNKNVWPGYLQSSVFSRMQRSRVMLWKTYTRRREIPFVIGQSQMESLSSYTQTDRSVFHCITLLLYCMRQKTPDWFFYSRALSGIEKLWDEVAQGYFLLPSK